MSIRMDISSAEHDLLFWMILLTMEKRMGVRIWKLFLHGSCCSGWHYPVY